MPFSATQNRELIARLREIVPAALIEPELLLEWTHDWWPLPGKLPVRRDRMPTVAVMVDSAEEVAAVVRLAAELGRTIVPRGGGSNVVGAIAPVAGAIMLDTRGLNVIEAVDELDLTAQVDAGVHGGELEERLNEQGYTLGHEPQSLYLSTVGGWIATRATGALATKYGGIEELIAGLEIVLADGTLIRSRPTPRHAAGPRWSDLFVGAEGTLGIVTEATLRVRPFPEERRFHAWGMPSYDGALDAIRRLLQRGITPAAIRLYDPESTRELVEHAGGPATEHLLLLVFDGPRAMVEVEERLAMDAFLAAGGRDQGPDPAVAWYEQRHDCAWIVDGNEPDGWIADVIDVAAPWSRLAAVIAAGRSALALHAAEVRHHSAHFYGHGGAVSFRFFVRETSARAAAGAYQRTWAATMRAVLDAGGSIVHHNGVGRVRAAWIDEELGEGIRVLRAMKHVLDPDGIFNPGWTRGRLHRPSTAPLAQEADGG